MGILKFYEQGKRDGKSIENNRKDYKKAGYRFVECVLCGKRYNAGRPMNGAAIRYCEALKNDYWARHIGEESKEVIHITEKEVKLCEKLKKYDLEVEESE